MKKIIIGARGSKLSLAYVSKVRHLISNGSKDIDIQIKTIKIILLIFIIKWILRLHLLVVQLTITL